MRKKYCLLSYINVIIAMSCVFSIFPACNGKDNAEGNSTDYTNQMYYIEEILDFETNYYNVYNTFVKDGYPVFYAAEDSSDGFVSRNVYKNGTLETEYPKHLNALVEDNIVSISESPNGTVLVLYADKDNNMRLSKISNDDVCRIDVNGWTTYNEMYNLLTSGEGIDYNGIMFPQNIIALDDSFLILYTWSDYVCQYDYNGNLLREFEVIDASIDVIASRNGVLTTLDRYNYEITLFDLNTGEVIDFFTNSDDMQGLKDAGASFIDIRVANGDGAPAFYSGNGIFEWDGRNFESIVDGEFMSLGMSAFVVTGLTRTDDGFFAVFKNGGKYQFARYYYGEREQADEVLTVFSLYDNATIRHAIGVFQQSNPGIIIDFRVGINLNIGQSVETLGIIPDDIIRVLNTEILAGRGPDLIVLDGLPVKSYIEKGVLKDISALIDGQINTGGFMVNMRNAFAYGNSVYGAPSRFTVPAMIGKSETLRHINSLSDLAGFIERYQSETSFLFEPVNLYTPVWSVTEQSVSMPNIFMNFYDASINHILNTDGTVNEENLASYLSDMLLIDRILKENTDENMLPHLRWHSSGRGNEHVIRSADYIADGANEIDLQILPGVYTVHYITSKLGEIEDMVIVPMFNNGAYFPRSAVGILNDSAQHVLAERFIELLLSDDVQAIPFNDGFAVNQRALQSALQNLSEQSGDNTKDMGFIDMCLTLDEPIFIDNIIKNAVKGQINALMNGDLSPLDAARNVVQDTLLHTYE